MKNIVIEGLKLTTSNKVSDEFKGDVPTKTAYIQVDEKNTKLLEEFGVRQYTPKEGKPFFILKLAQEVKIYSSSESGLKPTILDGTVKTPNFEITELPFKFNVTQGNKANNDFYRLQALLLPDTNLIKELEAENPFA